MATGHVEKRGKKCWTSVVLDYGYDAVGSRRRKRVTIRRPDGKPVTKVQAKTELPSPASRRRPRRSSTTSSGTNRAGRSRLSPRKV